MGLGPVLGKMRLPGFVTPMKYVDEVTADCFEVKITKRFTVIHINGNKFYFDRATGEFEGTGGPAC